jgi:glutamate/tyrosine decarboxylase-like PLP-dependent enzyme
MSTRFEEILLLNDEARERIWRASIDFVEEYLTTVSDRAVAPRLDPDSIRAFLEPFTFESTEQTDLVFRPIADALAAHQVHTPHPCYFGLFNPAPSTMGTVADMVVAALNPQLAAWTHSPLAVEIERHLVLAFATQFGLSASSADGTFTTGGSEANLTALLCALFRQWPEVHSQGVRALQREPVMYVSAEGHHSFVKAVRVAGLGDQALRHVAVDENLAMDPQKLREMIAADRRQGCAPFLLVGTAGSTSTGAIDPLPALAAIAKEEALWFHVDAAWAGAAQLVPAVRHVLRGIELADSITFDSHKWLSVPMGAGLFLTRHPDALGRTFELHARYMPREGGERAPVDPYAHSIQWSRRFIGLKLFLTLAATGWDGYAAVLAHQIEMGALLRDQLGRRGWRMVNKTVLPLVCFTPGDTEWTAEEHQAAADAVIASGRAWISTIVTARGQAALRACITSYRTLPQHIDVLVDAVQTVRSAH